MVGAHGRATNSGGRRYVCVCARHALMPRARGARRRTCQRPPAMGWQAGTTVVLQSALPDKVLSRDRDVAHGVARSRCAFPLCAPGGVFRVVGSAKLHYAAVPRGIMVGLHGGNELVALAALERCEIKKVANPKADDTGVETLFTTARVEGHN